MTRLVRGLVVLIAVKRLKGKEGFVMGFWSVFLATLGFGLAVVVVIVGYAFVVAVFQVLAEHLENKKAKKFKDDRGRY